MKAIVAVDENWGIGYQGNLLVRIPEDMRYFKQTTLGKVVVTGRETFETFPGKEPLPDRVNIVLSRNSNFHHDGVILCRSMEELFTLLRGYDTDDIFVIGGESVYTQLLPYCDEVYVTKIARSFMADRYFCNLDNDDSWKITSISEESTYKGIPFRYTKYVNSNVTEMPKV